jgi:8-oxo-dGTP pyrophosphatase MutT (NUDIX family)
MLRPSENDPQLTSSHRDMSLPTAAEVAQHLSDWARKKQATAPPSWQRESRAALGLISRSRGGQREYLFRYNRKWQRWNFVAGHFEPERDRDFIDTMVREFIEEVGEEIGEAPPVYGRDFSIEPLTTAPLEGVYFSGSAQQWTKYEFHVFWITLHGDLTSWDARWQRHPAQFRWFNKAEIEQEVVRDGQTLATAFPLGALFAIM